MTDNKKKTHLIVTGRGGGGSGEQVQADWSQTDDTQVDYIKNKPSLATVATSGDYDDLTNKPTIPAAPVQSDWNEADSSSLAYINNKPTIPPQQWFGTQAEYDLIDPKDPNVIYNIEGSDNVQADWNQNDSSADDYIKNKPTIPAAQVQSDWNQSDNTQVDYIKNKPTIPTLPPMTTETLTFTMQGGTTQTITFFTAITGYFYVEDASGNTNRIFIDKTNAKAPTIEVFKSTDQLNWESIGNTDTTAIQLELPANSKIYLKAVTDKWGTSNWSITNKISCNGNFNIGGNIMSLLYGDNFKNSVFTSDNTYAFSSLFYSDSYLVNAGNLLLPATTLVEGCYNMMLRTCPLLTTAPALPASTLANKCYYGMFRDCTGLTTAPTLPATTLANECYSNLFNGCTSLTTAPVLPATTLANQCYKELFSGCTNLNNVTTYADNISASNCTYNWLNNVSATGDFYNLGSVTYTSGASGIPSGWTEHTSL